MLLVLLLLFTSPVSPVSPLSPVSPAGPLQDGVWTRRLAGQRNPDWDWCRCEADPAMWAFPAETFLQVLERMETCQRSLTDLQGQLELSARRLPRMRARFSNATARLQPFQYLHGRGLYTALTLRELGAELGRLQEDIGAVHRQVNSSETQRLHQEVSSMLSVTRKMKISDTINMKTVRDKLRRLKNSVESCKSIPKDFRVENRHCSRGLIRGVSAPVTSLVSPYGKSTVSGSWGRQAQADSEGQRDSYWVAALLSGHIHGSSLRLYQSYQDFMAARAHQDFSFAPSFSDAKTLEGPSAVLYGQALYYHCYRSADVCRYDLKSRQVTRAPLPGGGVGFNNKFPYCYYDCRSHSDVDLEADETGLWAIYATVANHGNLVVSRLAWDAGAGTLNVTQTWQTRQFKKATSNAFMACGVLYATRYVDESREEVFYAFDTASGREDNSLALPLEKVSGGVASLSYNPTDRRLYLFNDGYLLAYQTLV